MKQYGTVEVGGQEYPIYSNDVLYHEPEITNHISEVVKAHSSLVEDSSPIFSLMTHKKEIGFFVLSKTHKKAVLMFDNFGGSFKPDDITKIMTMIMVMESKGDSWTPYWEACMLLFYSEKDDLDSKGGAVTA